MRPRVAQAAALSAMLALASPLERARAATIVYTNDVLGELEPCGCRNNPTGGMARKARLLEGMEDSQLLQLDAGDLLFETNSLPAALEKQAELQATYQLRAHALLGQDAVVPGEKDFALGLKKFEKLVGEHPKVQFLAANLVRKTGAPLLKSHAVFARKGADGKTLRIAVLGLVGHELAWPEGLRATPAVKAARKLVPELRKQADLVVALTHQGYEKDIALAKAVPGIDYIVGGHSQSFLQQPTVEGKTTIFQSSFRNQYVGLIPLPYSPDTHRLVALDAGYDPAENAPPSSKAAKLAALTLELKGKIAEMNSQEDARLTSLALPSDAAHSPKYQTFARCAECHMKQFDFWRQTPHALALQTLVDVKQEKNKDCLRCHTLGLGEKEGFSAVNELAARKNAQPLAVEELTRYLKSMHDAKSLETEVRIVRSEPPMPLQRSLSAIEKAWTPVQCENCHQAGRDHPFTGAYSKNVANEACLQCHTLARAPGWYKNGKPDTDLVAAKRKLVSCPAGELEPVEN